MTLSELVSLVKRTARAGSTSVTNDQVTADIILFTNNKGFELWRRWPWDWSYTEISYSQGAGVSDKTFDGTYATIGAIECLAAGGAPLDNLNFKEYLRWWKDEEDSPGSISKYIRIGRDSSGYLKIRFWPTPASATTITGWGKNRFTKYAVADIATNTALTFFPEETHQILYEMVLGEQFRVMNDNRYASQINLANAMILELIAEEMTQKDQQSKSPPPALFRFGSRKRGGTTVV
jgi:hypothetical protein